MSAYFELLLPEVRKRWKEVRKGYFNLKSSEARKAWNEIEAVVGGKCPLACGASHFFSIHASKIRRDKMKIRSDLVPLFRELEALRAQAETERERAELEFALALAKQHKGELPLSQLTLQVAEQLSDNVFVKSQQAIEKLVTNAKRSFASGRERLFTRSQMLYLHLVGIEVPLKKCSNKVKDDFTAAWKAVLGIQSDNSQKTAADNLQKEPNNGGSSPMDGRRSSRKRTAPVLHVDISDDESSEPDVKKKSAKDSIVTDVKKQKAMKDNSSLDNVEKEMKEVKPKKEVMVSTPKAADRNKPGTAVPAGCPSAIVVRSQLGASPLSLPSVVPASATLGTALPSSIASLQVNAANQGPKPPTSGTTSASPPVQVPSAPVVPKTPSDQRAKLFSRDAKVNEKEVFGDHIFNYVESVRNLLASGDKALARLVLEKAGDKVYEMMPESDRRGTALNILQNIYLAHYE